MKIPLLFAALWICAAIASAQPDSNASGNDMPIFAPELPLITPDEATRIVVKKPIALHLREVTLWDALQQLKAQSGVEFNLGERKSSETFEKTRSLDLETLSFDRAFDGILQAASVPGSLQSGGMNNPLRLELTPPFKFVFDAPVDWVQTEVPFAFQNVLLP